MTTAKNCLRCKQTPRKGVPNTSLGESGVCIRCLRDLNRRLGFPHGRRPTDEDVARAESNHERREMISDQIEWDEGKNR